MPKMKTAKGLAKRFKKTKTGKYKRHKCGRRHLKTAKSPKRVRSLRTSTMVSSADRKKVQKAIG